MIKASEIKKGNLFLHQGKIKQADGVDHHDYILVYNSYYDDFVEHIKETDAESIALTPDWMAKCGFNWNAEDQVYYIQVGNSVYIEYDVDFNCSVVPETWRGKPLHLWGDNKYLHKLQNIYFDHTGGELKIKQ